MYRGKSDQNGASVGKCSDRHRARALQGLPVAQADARFGLASRPRPSYTALSLQIVFAAQPLVTDPQGIWIGL